MELELENMTIKLENCQRQLRREKEKAKAAKEDYDEVVDENIALQLELHIARSQGYVPAEPEAVGCSL